MPTSCSWTRKVPCWRPSRPERWSTSEKRADTLETRSWPAATIFRSKRGDDALKNHMYNEIHEQPEVMATILEEEWGRVVGAAHSLRSRGFRFAMLTARGTSDNAAIYAKYLFEVLLGIPTALASPSIFTLYEGRMSLDDVLVVGISQSGESKDILETVGRTRELGASTLAITNDDGSSLAGAAEMHFSLRAGIEQSVAATKTY